MGGLWGLIVLDQLRKRDYFDFGYERHCCDLAFWGSLGAIIWIIRARNIASSLALIASIWISTIWMLDIATL